MSTEAFVISLAAVAVVAAWGMVVLLRSDVRNARASLDFERENADVWKRQAFKLAGLEPPTDQPVADAWRYVDRVFPDDPYRLLKNAAIRDTPGETAP